MPLLIVGFCVSTATAQAQPPVRPRGSLWLNIRAFGTEYVPPLGGLVVFVGEPLEFDIRVSGFSVESDWIRRIALTIRQGSVFDKEPPSSIPLKCDPLKPGTRAVGARIDDDTLVFDVGGYQSVRCRVYARHVLRPAHTP